MEATVFTTIEVADVRSRHSTVIIQNNTYRYCYRIGTIDIVFLPCDAMQAWPMLSCGVRLSVTFVDCQNEQSYPQIFSRITVSFST